MVPLVQAVAAELAAATGGVPAAVGELAALVAGDVAVATVVAAATVAALVAATVLAAVALFLLLLLFELQASVMAAVNANAATARTAEYGRTRVTIRWLSSTKAAPPAGSFRRMLRRLA